MPSLPKPLFRKKRKKDRILRLHHEGFDDDHPAAVRWKISICVLLQQLPVEEQRLHDENVAGGLRWRKAKEGASRTDGPNAIDTCTHLAK